MVSHAPHPQRYTTQIPKRTGQKIMQVFFQPIRDDGCPIFGAENQMDQNPCQ
jgi:hypothetical protein